MHHILVHMTMAPAPRHPPPRGTKTPNRQAQTTQTSITHNIHVHTRHPCHARHTHNKPRCTTIPHPHVCKDTETAQTRMKAHVHVRPCIDAIVPHLIVCRRYNCINTWAHMYMCLHARLCRLSVFANVWVWDSRASWLVVGMSCMAWVFCVHVDVVCD